MRTWIKPGGQQIQLNTRPETEQKAIEMGFVPHERESERPDIKYRIERKSQAQMDEESKIWLPPRNE